MSKLWNLFSAVEQIDNTKLCFVRGEHKDLWIGNNTFPFSAGLGKVKEVYDIRGLSV